MKKTAMTEKEKIPVYTTQEYHSKFIIDYGAPCPRRTKVSHWTSDDLKSRQGRGWNPVFDCIDCGVNTARIGEYYMVQDDIWYSFDLTRERVKRYQQPENRYFDMIVKNECMLCISCLERRLGRTLTHRDFTNCRVNDGSLEHEPLPQFKKSLRLQLRLMATHSRQINRKNKNVV